MPIIQIVQGNLLDTTEKYIVQQCNCVTVRSHGLSKSISDRFPYADVYSQRTSISSNRNCAKKFDTPGTIKICVSRDDQPNVICMFSQFCPGKSGSYSKYYPSEIDDSNENRILWFKKCLKEIEKADIKRVAMPYLIGCGLAGGDWKVYEKILNKSSLDIILYKL